MNGCISNQSTWIIFGLFSVTIIFGNPAENVSSNIFWLSSIALFGYLCAQIKSIVHGKWRAFLLVTIMSSTWLAFLGLLTSCKLLLVEDLELIRGEYSQFYHLFHHFKYLIIAGWFSVVCLGTAYAYITTNQAQRIMMTRLMFFLWFLSAFIGFALYWAGYQTNLNNNFSGILKDRNVFATCFVLFLALYFFQGNPFETKAMSIITILLTAASFTMIGYTQSLTGLIVQFILIGCVLFSRMHNHHKLMIVVAVMLSLVPSAGETMLRITKYAVAASQSDSLFLLVESNFGEKFSLRVDDDTSIHYNSSPAIRLSLIVSGLAVALEHFIAGVGLDNLRFFIKPAGFETGTFAHFNYIDILASGGVLTFVAYYGVFAVFPLYILLDIKCRQVLYDDGWMSLFIFLILFSISTQFTISTYSIFFFYFPSNFLLLMSAMTLLRARASDHKFASS